MQTAPECVTNPVFRQNMPSAGSTCYRGVQISIDAIERYIPAALDHPSDADELQALMSRHCVLASGGLPSEI